MSHLLLLSGLTVAILLLLATSTVVGIKSSSDNGTKTPSALRLPPTADSLQHGKYMIWNGRPMCPIGRFLLNFMVMFGFLHFWHMLSGWENMPLAVREQRLVVPLPPREQIIEVTPPGGGLAGLLHSLLYRHPKTAAVVVFTVLLLHVHLICWYRNRNEVDGKSLMSKAGRSKAPAAAEKTKKAKSGSKSKVTKKVEKMTGA